MIQLPQEICNNLDAALWKRVASMWKVKLLTARREFAQDVTADGAADETKVKSEESFFAAEA